MKNSVRLLGCLIAVVAAPALAQVSATQPAAAPVAAKPKLICKTMDTIGSRLQATKRCMTAADWQKLSRDEADDLDKRTRGVHSESGGG